MEIESLSNGVLHEKRSHMYAHNLRKNMELKRKEYKGMALQNLQVCGPASLLVCDL